MKLILKITSFHKFTPEIESVFVFESEDEYAKLNFGRSEECDWSLPDPGRVISGVHGEIIKFGDQYLVKDLSTNGTFINNSVTAIGQGNEVSLSSGDTLTLGDYQIEARIDTSTIDQSTDIQSHAPVSSYDAASASAPLNHDFGLSAAELAKEEIPSDFELDLGLVDDYIEVQSQQKIPDKAPAELSANQLIPTQPVRKNDGNEIEALIRGMSIDPKLVPTEHREQWFEQIGQSFSLMLVGLMDTLHNRAEFKQSNRLSHTSFKKSENNPLKFSANLEDAIYNLYNRQTSSFLTPNTAIKEAFADIESHEKALMKGVRGTVSSVMSLVEPATIYQDASSKSSVLSKIIPARKYAQSWSAFEGIHSGLKDEISNKETPFYLDDFAKHYELALKKEN